MKQYREKMDELRAPDSLRNQTLQTIRQQQAREEKKKPQRHPGRIWIPAVSLAAAACLIITIGFASGMMGERDLIYHKLPSTVVKTLPQNIHSNLTIEEYSTYLGMDPSSLIENAELIKFELLVEDEDGIILEDEGTFYYNVQGTPVMLRLSKTKAVVPETMKGKEASEIGGWNVVLGVNENGVERMAAFECGAIRCFLLTRQMDKQDFEKLLYGILRVHQ